MDRAGQKLYNVLIWVKSDDSDNSDEPYELDREDMLDILHYVDRNDIEDFWEDEDNPAETGDSAAIIAKADELLESVRIV